MTKEERDKAIEHISNILTEATQYDYSVCYVTMKDAKWLRLAIKALEQESCGNTISRQAVLDMMQMRMSGKELYKAVYDLPPATPQPPMGYISIDDVMSVFDDFMCGEVDEDGTDTFLEMLKDKAEREDE